MRAPIVLIVSTVILLLAMSAAPGAASAPPLDVEFEVETTIPPDLFPTFGPFTATGPAVDAGIVCPTGETIDVFGKAAGSQSPEGVNLQVVKRFTCDDGSGDFLVKLQVRLDKKGNNFNWNILEGTGAYESFHGTGRGIGVPIEVGVLDIYSGHMHND